MSYDKNSVPVMFKGEPFIWLKFDDGSGPLAYPQHVDEQGYVKALFCMSESFAHVMDNGEIVRFGRTIGSVGDLVVNSKLTP